MKRIEINEKQFKRLIDGVKHRAAHDDIRPGLKYIQIKVAADTITAYAIDGYRAGRVEIKNACPTNEEFTCYIKPLTFKISKRGVNPVVIEQTDEKTFVEIITEYGVLRYGFTAPKDEFIDVEKLFAAHRPHDRELGLRTRYVIDALKALNGIILNSGSESVAILESKENNKQPFIIRAKSENITNEQLVLPVKIKEYKNDEDKS